MTVSNSNGSDTVGQGRVIQGRNVAFPVLVRDASSATATYLVSTKAARRILPTADFEPMEILPGRCLFSLACIDYRDNDLGDYNEVSFAFFVRAAGSAGPLPYLSNVASFAHGRVATYIFWLPVDQSFTQEAGKKIWGFPKTVEDIEFGGGPSHVTCSLRADDREVLTMSMKRGGERNLPESILDTYTHIDGKPHRTSFRSSASGVGMSVGGTELTLGDHPVSDQLRSLGLPKKALVSMWMQHMSARFDPPQPL